MHFQSLPLFKLSKNYLKTQHKTVRKVVDLRTRNQTNFSLYFSDFSTILYGFYKFIAFENKLETKVYKEALGFSRNRP